ncbi:sulfotransferase [Planosporangium flavigriseum]|uniref:Sulfotransferase family protein n=1 Tax=Planosporangium flavigriseum TaxID=373681 RepID=A0A8J3M3Y7_9ACTN|nr:sulfotransferase [Planosporangium flavigriseum]NJC67943.1 sulfotransferase [Planosporangium flavigriseum]GIG76470.1 hypothetical protein Pfl04_48740 [Planosporangium flavigriseum]
MGQLRFLLVGTARSGTTLTQRICCELPGVAMPPETHLLQLLAPDLLTRRRFPLAAGEVVDELLRFEALPTSTGLKLDHERVLDLVGPRCDSLFALFEAVVVALCPPQPDGSVYGEKTPEHLLWWRAMTAANEALRVVGVVRDPRAVAASHRAVPWGIRDAAELAEEWAFDQRQLAGARRRLGPRRCLILRYEDLVAAPDAARARLGRFLGVPVPDEPVPDEPVPDESVNPSQGIVSQGIVSQGIVGSWEWWKSRALQPVTTDRTEAWREGLSSAEAAVVVAVAAPEMARFGYLTGTDRRRSRTGPGDRVRDRLAARLRRMRKWEALSQAATGR